MDEKDLRINYNCHVIYSNRCKEIILTKIQKHYDKEKINDVFECVQHQYEKYLNEYNRKDLGGINNPSNGTGGTYDWIMMVCYYVVCKRMSSFDEIQNMIKELTSDSFKGPRCIDINDSSFRQLFYNGLEAAKMKCDKFHDFDMHLDSYSDAKPLHYYFSRCPFADFIHQFGLEEIAGAICNVDYSNARAMNIKLVRQNTLIEGDICDYTFYSFNDLEAKNHQEYVDENGFIRNK